MANSTLYKTRTRNWFLTVHKESACFNQVPKICDRMDSSKVTWAYIIHEPENVEILDISDTHNRKGEHYHICLSFENAKTFHRIQTYFPGAHIEASHVIADCASYLLHNTDMAIKQGKKQYDVEQIVTNNRPVLYSWLGDRGMRFRPFNSTRIPEYVLVDNLRSYTEFMMVFGDAVQRWLPSINQVIKECRDCKSIADVMHEKDETNRGIACEAEQEGVDITSNSVNYVSSCSIMYELNGKCKPVVEFLITYQKWEFMDVEGFDYFKANYPQKWKYFKLDKMTDKDFSYIIEYLCEVRDNKIL